MAIGVVVIQEPFQCILDVSFPTKARAEVENKETGAGKWGLHFRGWGFTTWIVRKLVKCGWAVLGKWGGMLSNVNALNIASYRWEQGLVALAPLGPRGSALGPADFKPVLLFCMGHGVNLIS